MEAVFASTDHRSISPYNKQIKNSSKRNNPIRGFTSRPTSENLAPSNHIHGGFLFAHPPSLSFSYPPPSYSAPLYPHQQQTHPLVTRQPPLLPLPVSRSLSSLPSRTRDFSCQPPNTTRKANRAKDHSRTPKKSKQPVNNSQKEEPKQDPKIPTKSLINNAPTVPLGPDPKHLPKDVSKVLSSSSPPSSSFITGNGGVINLNNNLTGTFFTPSPPPSSLPLPKFSIRPKALSCTTEAAGTDAGATDSLRRILRL